jgi:hypothetical protein
MIAALCLRAGRNLTKEEWARYIGLDTPWQPGCRDLPSTANKISAAFDEVRRVLQREGIQPNPDEACAR